MDADIEKNHPFMVNIWQSDKTAEEQFKIPELANMHFYDLGTGPKLNLTDADLIYSKIEKTPFPSLYSYHSATEHFAELAAFDYLSTFEGFDYRIEVLKTNPDGDSVIAIFRPLEKD